MLDVTVRNGVPQLTLEHFTQDYADRHLLHGVVAKWADQMPDATALIEYDTGKEYTYKQFDQVTTLLALKLLSMGFAKGDFLATSLPLLAEHVFLEYACFKIGVIATPLDLRLKGPEVIRCLGLVRPKGYAFLGKIAVADFRELGKAVQANCDYIEHFIQFSPPEETIDGAISAFTLSAEAIAEGQAALADPDAHPIVAQYREATASIVRGRRRAGDLHDRLDGLSQAGASFAQGDHLPKHVPGRGVRDEPGRDPDAGSTCRRPHVGCQTEQLMTPFFWGTTAGHHAHLRPREDPRRDPEVQGRRLRPDPGAVCHGMAAAQLQGLRPVVAAFSRSTAASRSRGRSSNRLSQMAPQFGTGLGLTELARLCHLLAAGRHGRRHPGRGRLRHAGHAADDPQADGRRRNGRRRAARRRDRRDLLRRAAGLSDLRQQRRGVPQDRLHRRRLLHTGDLGFKNETGLHFSGRSKLVIKPKGYHVHPAQIEEHFALLADKVSTCAAVGRAARRVHRRRSCFSWRPSKPDTELTQDELNAHAKKIAAYMRPSHYELLPPGEFPLNPGGQDRLRDAQGAREGDHRQAPRKGGLGTPSRIRNAPPGYVSERP